MELQGIGSIVVFVDQWEKIIFGDLSLTFSHADSTPCCHVLIMRRHCGYVTDTVKQPNKISTSVNNLYHILLFIQYIIIYTNLRLDIIEHKV